jgi:hypothetical protein
MGEASKMENFTITDAYNLSLRPGVRRIDFAGERDPAPLLAAWAGFLEQRDLLLLCDFADGTDRLFVYERGSDEGHTLIHRQDGALGLTKANEAKVNVFTFNGDLYVMSVGHTVIYDGEQFVRKEPYIPLVIAGADPAGGGTTLENINLLSAKRRMNFSADGTSTAYYLPNEAVGVVNITIDNVEQDVATSGKFDADTRIFTFNTAPVKGVGNVEIVYKRKIILFSHSSLIGIASIEELIDLVDHGLFVAAPKRSNQILCLTVARKPSDHGGRRQKLERIGNQTNISVTRQRNILAAFVECGKPCSL